MMPNWYNWSGLNKSRPRRGAGGGGGGAYVPLDAVWAALFDTATAVVTGAAVVVIYNEINEQRREQWDVITLAKKTPIPSGLKDGGKVKTPDTHPGEFEKVKGQGGTYRHKDTGWIFSPDTHGGRHWDAAPKKGGYGDYRNVLPDGRIRP